MLKKKNLAYLGIFIVLVVSILMMGKYLDLYSIANIIPNTPQWQFVHSCADSKCSSSVYNIGELSLSSSAPIFHKEKSQCLTDKKITSFGEPSSDCWSVNFTFDGNSYELYPNQEVQLNDYLKVGWQGSGHVLLGSICHSDDGIQTCKSLNYGYDWDEPVWSNTYSFGIIKEFLKSSLVSNNVYGTILGNYSIQYKIENNLTNIGGGSIIRQNSVLFTPEKSQIEQAYKINKGINTEEAIVDSSYLGNNGMSITPFAVVYSKVNDVSSPIYIYSNKLNALSNTLPVEPIYQKEYPIEYSIPNEVHLSSESKSKILLIVILGGILISIALLLSRKNND